MNLMIKDKKKKSHQYYTTTHIDPSCDLINVSSFIITILFFCLYLLDYIYYSFNV